MARADSANSEATHAAAAHRRGSAGETETEHERLDRNWSELLQELRVTQTGTQILTGFLLTLAFQGRFEDLDSFQIVHYLVLVGLAAVATGLNLGPVSLHRALFRKRAKRQIVFTGHMLLRATLVTVALLVVGVVMFIFDVVVSRPAGFIAGAGAIIVVAFLWVVVPRLSRGDRDEHGAGARDEPAAGGARDDRAR